MDVLSVDVENYGCSRSKHLNFTGKVLNSSRKLGKKTSRPLSDLKNIINNQNLATGYDIKKLLAENRECDLIEENGDLFFFEDSEDDFDDIIPRYLQLEDSDIKKFAITFDNPMIVDIEDEDTFQPLSEPEDIVYSEGGEEISGVFKDLHDDELFFDPTEI